MVWSNDLRFWLYLPKAERVLLSVPARHRHDYSGFYDLDSQWKLQHPNFGRWQWLQLWSRLICRHQCRLKFYQEEASNG